MSEDNPAAQAHVNAQADLQAAEAAAAALLADLSAKDVANGTATVQPRLPSLPSRYAPGDAPDPVKGVAAPGGGLPEALGSFHAVDFETLRKPTNTESHKIDFAAKIKAAQKPYGNH